MCFSFLFRCKSHLFVEKWTSQTQIIAPNRDKIARPTKIFVHFHDFIRFYFHFLEKMWPSFCVFDVYFRFSSSKIARPTQNIRVFHRNSSDFHPKIGPLERCFSFSRENIGPLFGFYFHYFPKIIDKLDFIFQKSGPRAISLDFIFKNREIIFHFHRENGPHFSTKSPPRVGPFLIFMGRYFQIIVGWTWAGNNFFGAKMGRDLWGRGGLFVENHQHFGADFWKIKSLAIPIFGK